MALCLSLNCEVDLVLALCLASSERLYLLREELCTPSCICPNPQWRFPVWEVLCGRYSGNPFVCRRGRRAVARTSKHISVFAFDPLSLTLSRS